MVENITAEILRAGKILGQLSAEFRFLTNKLDILKKTYGLDDAETRDASMVLLKPEHLVVQPEKPLEINDEISEGGKEGRENPENSTLASPDQEPKNEEEFKPKMARQNLHDRMVQQFGDFEKFYSLMTELRSQIHPDQPTTSKELPDWSTRGPTRILRNPTIPENYGKDPTLPAEKYGNEQLQYSGDELDSPNDKAQVGYGFKHSAASKNIKIEQKRQRETEWSHSNRHETHESTSRRSNRERSPPRNTHRNRNAPKRRHSRSPIRKPQYYDERDYDRRDAY